MTYSLTSIEVAEYSQDFITNVIRHVTRWSSRAEVLDKAHIAYLANYLKAIGVKTVVFESDYIDRHYLEDYSEYYARCFQTLPKTCARLHFFRSKFSEEALSSALNEINLDFIQTYLQSEGAYAGFVVIRPLPVTCIARMCLMPYEHDDRALMLTDKVHVSFSGIDLSVDTAAFIEQDKVVSACATSAIWALLNANRTFRTELLPSPSAITKSALSSDRNGSRTFPASSGLQVEHVCRSLKAYGLEPTVIDRADYDEGIFLEIVKRVLAAYLPSNIPVLIGGRVFELKDDSSTALGEHLVCALGYKANAPVDCALPETINRIYVHDDRYGPYVSLPVSSDKQALDFELRQNIGATEQCIRRERFEPLVLIVGLNHKIRIDFEYAFNVAAALSEVIDNYRLQYPKDCKSEFIEFADCDFKVTLCYSSTIKKEFIDQERSFSFNGTAEPSAFFTANMPKYVWRCQFTREDTEFADILLDATGVPQGDLVLGCLSYTPSADSFWRAMSKFIATDYYKSATTELAPGVPNVIGCINRFFLNFEDNHLDAHYGPLRIPARPYRPSEVDQHGDQLSRVDTIKIGRGNPASVHLEALDKSQTQIWVIDRNGDIVIGKEAESDPNRQGHPALTGGGPARLAGELKYCYNENCWEINAQSRTYANHLFGNPERANRYLDSVINGNLADCSVRKAVPPIRR